MPEVRSARRLDLAVCTHDDVLSELNDLSVAKGRPSVFHTLFPEFLQGTGAQREQRNATLGVIEYGLPIKLLEERRLLERPRWL